MTKIPTVFIKTFGCLQNQADSERIKYHYWKLGYSTTDIWTKAQIVVINTCMIRESAENRAYGLINIIDQFNKKRTHKIRIIVTGCMVGAMGYQRTGKEWALKFPQVEEWLPISVFDYGSNEPLRDKKQAAIIPISNGCNNYCSYCIVPFTRGKEKSRPIVEIIDEALKVKSEQINEIVLVGQNVNSYGSDFDGNQNWVNMGKKRFKSTFPKLLDQIAKMGFEKISFVSSNPWDFSDELIRVIANNPNIDRLIHLPLQSGDNEVLKKMNRGYTANDYLKLVSKIKREIAGVRISTDIIVGFPDEDDKAFNNTVKVCTLAGFSKAYINKYSPRKGTLSAKIYKNNIKTSEKKRRWMVLDKLINQQDKLDQ